MGTKCSATRAVCTILHIPHGRTFTMEVNLLTLTPCLNTNTSGNIGIPTSPHYTTRSRVSTNAAVKPGRNTKAEGFSGPRDERHILTLQPRDILEKSSLRQRRHSCFTLRSFTTIGWCHAQSVAPS